MSASLPPYETERHPTFDGESFSNNLLSDLAPLLTLFGEQVTKQFLSMSMGWADDILLALGPLGIMTIVVSNIRVGGVRRLKAIVGRARESRAAAEAELLSSTSHEVCEMWNGQEIVRTFGQPHTEEMILVFDERELKAVDLRQACLNGWMSARNKDITPNEIQDLGDRAPNITLNLDGSVISKLEIWSWVCFGLVIQAAVAILPGVLTYRWHQTASPHAYPCYLVSLVCVTMGLILCSRVIEGSTKEHEFVPSNAGATQVVRIQMACTVNDQRFLPYLLDCSPPKEARIRTSRLIDDRKYASVPTRPPLPLLLPPDNYAYANAVLARCRSGLPSWSLLDSYASSSACEDCTGP
jgi:hypothetical protein